MTTWTRNVFSSNVDSISYDTETQEMEVRWTKGKRRISIYSDVPESVADQASRTISVGNFLRDNVRDYYKHRYG